MGRLRLFHLLQMAGIHLMNVSAAVSRRTSSKENRRARPLFRPFDDKKPDCRVPTAPAGGLPRHGSFHPSEEAEQVRTIPLKKLPLKGKPAVP